jgi:hypothetical protein
VPKTAKPKAPTPIKLPDLVTGVDEYWIFGLDPSLSRTGYALSILHPSTGLTEWAEIGSVKPVESSNPVWVRSKLLALHVKHLLLDKVGARSTDGKVRRLIISLEQPPPGNDWLSSINRIFHVELFGDNLGHQGQLEDYFSTINVLHTNANTLRSIMGLVQRGNKNKAENQAKAKEFVPDGLFPEIDTDACDGVLLSMMGSYVANLQLGHVDTVPEKALNSLCSAAQIVKGKGRNHRILTQGSLWRAEYWYTYECKTYQIAIKDAKLKTKSLRKENVIL